MKYLPFVMKNLGRNKLRSVLTGLATALAIALVCIFRTVPAGMDSFLTSIASNTRVSTHNEAGMVYAMPYSYLQKVRAVPGVVAAVSWQWFGGALDRSKGVEFPNFAVDAEDFGKVYEDYNVAPQALEDFRKYRNAAIVGHQTLEKFRWKVGDVVTLQSTVFPLELSFKIVGEVPNPRSSQFYFQREYLTQAFAAAGTPTDTTGMIWSRIDDPDRVEPAMKQIDEMFSNSEAETTSETEKSFFGNFMSSLKGFVMLIQFAAGIVALCIVFIAANTASMSVRERVGELAILKAIGFPRRTIFSTLLAEVVLLSTVAGVVGALISLGFTYGLRKIGSGGPQMGPLTGFIVTNTILVQALFLSFFVGIVSGWLPALGASKRSVAQSLREVF
jgi:putative ABC transport system permease protein